MLCAESDGVYADFSRQRVTPETLKVRRCPVTRCAAAAAPHTAQPLRCSADSRVPGERACARAEAAQPGGDGAAAPEDRRHVCGRAHQCHGGPRRAAHRAARIAQRGGGGRGPQRGAGRVERAGQHQGLLGPRALGRVARAHRQAAEERGVHRHRRLVPRAAVRAHGARDGAERDAGGRGPRAALPRQRRPHRRRQGAQGCAAARAPVAAGAVWHRAMPASGLDRATLHAMRDGVGIHRGCGCRLGCPLRTRRHP